MDFMNRSAAPGAQHVNGAPAAATKRRWKEGPMWLRVVWIFLLFSATIVLASLATLLYLGGSKEGNFVDKDKQQAVFLTNGQVYFGKIKSVTGKYITLEGIYYLNVNQQVQPKQQTGDSKQQQTQSSISLVKLGCELHGPADKMVINRDQVTFWENLRTDGQVDNAIEKWVADNPDGQKCTTPSASNTQTNKP